MAERQKRDRQQSSRSDKSRKKARPATSVVLAEERDRGISSSDPEMPEGIYSETSSSESYSSDSDTTRKKKKKNKKNKKKKKKLVAKRKVKKSAEAKKKRAYGTPDKIIGNVTKPVPRPKDTSAKSE
jgi:hypothetical protein